MLKVSTLIFPFPFSRPEPGTFIFSSQNPRQKICSLRFAPRKPGRENQDGKTGTGKPRTHFLFLSSFTVIFLSFIMYCLACSLHVFDVCLSVCRLSVCLSSVCLSSVCLSSVCLSSVCRLSVVCLSSVCHLSVCHLSVCRLSVVCLSSVCCLSVCRLSVVCLSVCLRRQDWKRG
jgi:hypothetical protein